MKHSSPRSLSIVMPLYVDTPWRLDYLRKCCASLARTQIPAGVKVQWYIFDDCSPLAWDACLVPLSPFAPTIHRLAGNRGANSACAEAITAGLTTADYTVSIEMDMLVHPEWLVRLLALERQHPEGAAWTCFNAFYHPVIERLSDGQLRKASLSGNLLLVGRHTWCPPATDLAQIRAECGHKTWDWSFLHRAGVLRGRAAVYCTSPSYAQHIGMVGASYRWGELDYDRAMDFIDDTWVERTLVPQVREVWRSPEIPLIVKGSLLLGYPKCLLKRIARPFRVPPHERVYRREARQSQ